MAFKRTLIQRLFNISKISNPALTSSRISSSSSTRQSLIPPNPEKAAPDPGDGAIFRRFLQRRPLYQSAAMPPELWSQPSGEKLFEMLRGMDIARDRVRLEGLSPPAERTESTEGNLTVEDARKLLRLAQLETVKTKLRGIEKSCVSYTEFVQICAEGCSSTDEGLQFGKMLDESGTVIVLGNVVFLRPDQGSETLLRQI